MENLIWCLLSSQRNQRLILPSRKSIIINFKLGFMSLSMLTCIHTTTRVCTQFKIKEGWETWLYFFAFRILGLIKFYRKSKKYFFPEFERRNFSLPRASNHFPLFSFLSQFLSFFSASLSELWVSHIFSWKFYCYMRLKKFSRSPFHSLPFFGVLRTWQ